MTIKNMIPPPKPASNPEYYGNLYDHADSVRVRVRDASEAAWLARERTGLTQTAFAAKREVPSWVPGEWEIGRMPGQYPVPKDIWPGHEFMAVIPMSSAMRFERWKRRITQEALGALLGVSRQTINSWENMGSGWQNLARSWGLPYA